MQTILVTGAAGFIGSALCRMLRQEKLAFVVGVDALTYAGSRESLGILANDSDFRLIEADVADARAMGQIFEKYRPDGLIHLAAETHVDRSIDGSAAFLRTNIVGTYALLETTRVYLAPLEEEQRRAFRFLHVSSDEVYGALFADSPALSEDAPYAPSSPYAATKAASDHLARAWHKTFDLPVIVSNGSNTYGPLQFPEKLLPLAISKALRGEPIPLYGKGDNIRDWLYVDDHARALIRIFSNGRVGETYHIGGGVEMRNIDIVRMLCDLLDEARPDLPKKPCRDLISFVEDRPGHDFRYALDCSKIAGETGWKPEISLEDGLRETVRWYAHNQSWCEAIWTRKYALQRLGKGS